MVRKAPGQAGFAVITRCRVVEHTLAWLTAHRRLVRDYERHPATSEAIIRWAGSAAWFAASRVAVPPRAGRHVFLFGTSQPERQALQPHRQAAPPP
ncbi:hypothetical protein GCM10010517_58830 [Streptosporangium fragile]|uniref:Transposase DDE domain-containing protein n=1 Tax=Streptosporangium fragile TaxID=46186 RepID=A0ABN3W764_9ACTN